MLQKDKECFGSKLEPNGQITVNIVLYGGTLLYGRTPSFQTDLTCTVLYGVLRYGTVITAKKAEVRRISTSLVLHRLHCVHNGSELFSQGNKALAKKTERRSH